MDMKKRNIFLISFAVILILSAGIGEAWAYFTTYARAEGGYHITVGHETKIKEKVYSWTKTVTIENKEGSGPVYVRLRAFGGEDFELTYIDDSGKWFLGDDGCWYYKDYIKGGEETLPLDIKIGNVPEDVKENASFNIVVIYECTPVLHDKDGNPYGDWSDVSDSGNLEGGVK